jgi:NADH-quinone oxidoreductase subunit G
VDDAPILDLRLRKGVRRHGVKLAIASARPSSLDRNAAVTFRHPPGGEAALMTELAHVLDGADTESDELRGLATLLRDGGEDVVIVWSERIGAEAAAALARIAESLELAGRSGAGLLEIPTGANGRGLREAGAVADAGPGYAALAGEAGNDAAGIARAAADGELTALYLLQTDPVRDQPDRALWESALDSAALVVAHASVMTEGLREHATVIFPAESHAEKDGTVVHPDGRLQRLRIAIQHPGEVRAGWAVLAELARRAGSDFEVTRSADAFAQLVATVPFYAGLTLEELGGHGVRWPETDAAAAFPAGDTQPSSTPINPYSPAAQTTNGHAPLRLGTYRPIWASPEVEVSPALKYLAVQQQLELAPEDAQRLGVAHGDEVQVAQNGHRVLAKATIRTGVPVGSAFLADGISAQSANALTEPLIEVRKA